MKRISLSFFVASIAFALMTTACSDKTNPSTAPELPDLPNVEAPDEPDSPDDTKPAVGKLWYAFGDASVAPQYHRSYDITVDRTTAKIVVDSYGDTLATKTYTITPKKYLTVVKAYHDAKLRSCRMKEDVGCTGGTSESARAFGEKPFEGTVYHCGGEDSGNMCGDIASFATAMKALIPDLPKLTE